MFLLPGAESRTGMRVNRFSDNERRITKTGPQLLTSFLLKIPTSQAFPTPVKSVISDDGFLVPFHRDYVVELAQPRPRGSYVTVPTSLYLTKLKQDEVLTGKNA